MMPLMTMQWRPFPEKSLSTPPPIGWLMKHKATFFLSSTFTTLILAASPLTSLNLRKIQHVYVRQEISFIQRKGRVDSAKGGGVEMMNWRRERGL